jgi:hypothetical protein
MGNATCIAQDGFPALLWLEVLVLLEKSERLPEFPHEILEVPVGLGHWSGPGVLKGPGGVNCRDG